jgi:hypothetical protein
MRETLERGGRRPTIAEEEKAAEDRTQAAERASNAQIQARSRPRSRRLESRLAGGRSGEKIGDRQSVLFRRRGDTGGCSVGETIDFLDDRG